MHIRGSLRERLLAYLERRHVAQLRYSQEKVMTQKDEWFMGVPVMDRDEAWVKAWHEPVLPRIPVGRLPWLVARYAIQAALRSLTAVESWLERNDARE